VGSRKFTFLQDADRVLLTIEIHEHDLKWDAYDAKSEEARQRYYSHVIESGLQEPAWHELSEIEQLRWQIKK
jgi:hypothetical protein